MKRKKMQTEEQSGAGLLARLVGTGKGSGAALLMLVLGFAGVAVCLVFGGLLRKYHWTDER